MSDKNHYDCDVAVIGAGIVGIACAYYLKQSSPQTSVMLLDSGQPMALTSAQSGENYRNWWPHPVMTAFTEHSIDLMEELATHNDNILNMTRRGYTLATRENDTDSLTQELLQGYSQQGKDSVRVHQQGTAPLYQPAFSADWNSAPNGVDILKSRALIQRHFPSFNPAINTVVHIRRAGSISSQQMGQLMLDKFKSAGGTRVTASVSNIEQASEFRIYDQRNHTSIHTQQLVNAAGPFINDVASMLGTELPVYNTLQQKIAFEDTKAVVPRQMPFAIDLDPHTIDWTDEEKQLLAESAEYRWLSEEMPGAIHCRPDGGDNGRWVKLGWAFNERKAKPQREPALLDSFPEIALRGAAQLNPALKSYYGNLPRNTHHYGGFYTMTDENWPLIGEMDIAGTYVVGAMSGFGTMAACAAGDLCARLVLGNEVPAYAQPLAPSRYKDEQLMSELRSQTQRGVL